MARKTGRIVIEREGRDKGVAIVITEMAAYDAADWFMRAGQILVRSGADVPPNVLEMGVGGFVAIAAGVIAGSLGKAPWYEVKPLLVELEACVTSFQRGDDMPLTDWRLIKGQIEEPGTFAQIYEEVISLHLGFSLAARLSTYRTLAVNMIAALTQNTETSISTSEQS